MTRTRDIRLEGDKVDPDSEVDGWWVDGRVVTVRSGPFLTTYRLPRGSTMVSYQRLGNGRAMLGLGGFTSRLVTVTGPANVIEKLREACL